MLTCLRASTKTWDQCSRAWAKALKDLGIARFHASECENRKKAFKGISNGDRDEIQNTLIEVANKFNFLVISTGISRSMHLQAIAPLTDEPIKKYVSSTYGFLFSTVIGQMLVHKHGMMKKERIAFFFDRQDEFKGTAEQAYTALKHDPQNKSRMGALIFLDKDDPEAIPLQIADLLAYESYKFLAGSATTFGPKVSTRWQGKKLLDPIRSKNMLEIRQWSDDSIKRLHQKATATTAYGTK